MNASGGDFDTKIQPMIMGFNLMSVPFCFLNRSAEYKTRSPESGVGRFIILVHTDTAYIHSCRGRLGWDIDCSALGIGAYPLRACAHR